MSPERPMFELMPADDAPTPTPPGRPALEGRPCATAAKEHANTNTITRFISFSFACIEWLPVRCGFLRPELPPRDRAKHKGWSRVADVGGDTMVTEVLLCLSGETRRMSATIVPAYLPT